MSNVVRLDRLPPMAATSPAFEEAWVALPQAARTRSSRKLAYPEWVKAARITGELELVAAVKRYVAEDKDHKRECGPPGFDRWLKWGRYEHWTAGPAVEVKTVIFADAKLRAAFHLKFTDERARRWFDRCRLEGDTIIGPDAKQEWLYGPFAQWGGLNGIGGYKRD